MSSLTAGCELRRFSCGSLHRPFALHLAPGADFVFVFHKGDQLHIHRRACSRGISKNKVPLLTPACTFEPVVRSATLQRRAGGTHGEAATQYGGSGETPCSCRLFMPIVHADWSCIWCMQIVHADCSCRRQHAGTAAVMPRSLHLTHHGVEVNAAALLLADHRAAGGTSGERMVPLCGLGPLCLLSLLLDCQHRLYGCGLTFSPAGCGVTGEVEIHGVLRCHCAATGCGRHRRI